MAEAVLEVVLDNLSSLVQKEVGLLLGFDQDLKSLASLLTTIKATLEDAEEKQFSNRAIKDWLQKLKDAAYVLDDILDECNTQALEYEGSKVHNSFLSSLYPKHVGFRYKLAKKMKRIRERLDEIAAERNKFHLTQIIRERRSRVIDWRETTSIITQPQVYGRDEEKDQIVDFLIREASEREDLSVYPLIGIGGLGKTTLAQLIFNHEKIINHFELRIWVCVSEDFSLKRMTRAIIGSASGNVHGFEDLDLEPLQRKLQELLQKKRYLLVLDDLWDEEQENWQRLKSVLACGGMGASILVTTRLPKVAEIMGTMPAHKLSMLSDKDCWELFKQRAFGPNEVESANLVAIGNEIMKKCGGVPLAALALGSLLRFKREEEEWLYVKESNLWSLQGENSIMPALRLSYLYLPLKLRQCFAFCALFPKDERISKQLLIELWVANGFISSNEMFDAEDIGNEVWNELHWISFFQDIRTDKFGKIKDFTMHDLVHDLAQSVTEEIFCSTYHNSISITNISQRIRHLSITNYIENVNSIRLDHVKSLKTYMEPNMPYGNVHLLPTQLLKCNSLRVLLKKGLSNLSTSIGHLKYLRYLDISHGGFKNLPESLCSLCNLEVLKLDYCNNLEKLPDKFLHLKALQHLSLTECNSLSRLPREIGKLTSLMTLSIYIVGKKRGSLLEELGQLNLKGKLHIKHLERVRSATDAKEAKMSRKHLNQLQLSWGRNEESQLQENVEQILEVLQPHTPKLRSLGLGGYKGTCFPQWISGSSLKDLNSLELKDCTNCLNLPELGKLPSLKYLTISNMSHVICMCEVSCDGGFGGLMALEVLILEKLPNLMRLSRDDGENMFPRLSNLRVSECPNLLTLPCLPSLSGLFIEGKYNQDLPKAIHKFGNLKFLNFSNNEELICFPYGILRNLTSLNELIFHQYPILEQLPTEIINLNSLQKLYIRQCGNIKSLSDEVLTVWQLHSLRELLIIGCNQFNMFTGFQYLTNLDTLTIGSCSKVEGLHEALQHMTALKTLTLSDLPNLLSLPDCLGNLSSLQSLTICVCPKLTCLPTTFQQLNKLKSFCIYCCPKLERRCKKEIGEDWSKIAHVQYIHIESRVLILG